MNSSGITFEDFGKDNGIRYWLASELMAFLGYDNMLSFQRPINKAIQTCSSAGIDIFENFIKSDDDYKLSRFACYLVAMNSDPKKETVAKAQAYFAKIAEETELMLEGSNDTERILIRQEIKVSNIELAKSAKQHGVTNFALFQDAGYRGLYNRSLQRVSNMKGIPRGDKLLEYMGRTELAANLFRITMTEERLKANPSIKTQSQSESVHQHVGDQVRKIVIENAGIPPEELPIERRLPAVIKELKKAKTALNKKGKK